MNKLWTEDEPEHAGTYYQFPPLRFHPRPVQTPRPPILLGGVSKWVFQRAAAFADRWAPWMIDPEGLARGRQQLLHEFDKAGRDPGTADVTVFTRGLANDIVKRYALAGADRIVFTTRSTPDADPFGRIETLAKAVGL
jgi:alkanesulfonate monooxygenase SsuD/methylene tetrahydromethanopterin reductase-like flavin-dependent oxidoreductase (luciferase family)